jgi:hypothetical protein
LLRGEVLDGLTGAAPVGGEFQDGVFALLGIELQETLK